MKNILYIPLIFLSSLISVSLYPQGTWELLDTPTDQHLRSVFFTDSLYGWAVGDTGTIIHTQDGGDSWIMQDAGTENNIVHVFFLNRQTGWASSWNYQGYYGTLILKTVDGGSTWNAEPYQEDNIFINSILYLDENTGWMGGSPHALVRTSDGGQSWNQAQIDTSALAFFPVLNVYFYDDIYGYACGGMFDIAGVTWSTSDGGQSWHPIENADAPADEIHGMHLFDSLSVLGAGGDPDLGYGVGMLRTDDGGMNWDYEELSMAGNAFDIDFRNAVEAWAPLGPAQELIYSMDVGTTWTVVATPASSSIFDMTFTDSIHGYGVGYNGAVIRYIPKPVNINEHNEEDSHALEIFPNPARAYLNVRTSVLNGSIQVHNMNSTLIKSLKFHKPSHTNNVIRIDLSEIPSGVYFIAVHSSDSTGIILREKFILW